MKIALVLDTICDGFLAACESIEQAERYIVNTGIRGFAKVKEVDLVGEELVNDALYVVTRAKNKQYVYCSGKPIKELDGKDYVSEKITIMKKINAIVSTENSGEYVFNPMRGLDQTRGLNDKNKRR